MQHSNGMSLLNSVIGGLLSISLLSSQAQAQMWLKTLRPSELKTVEKELAEHKRELRQLCNKAWTHYKWVGQSDPTQNNKFEYLEKCMGKASEAE